MRCPSYACEKREGLSQRKGLWLQAQEAAYRETAEACLAQASNVNAWNDGNGRGGRLLLGDSTAAGPYICFFQQFYSLTLSRLSPFVPEPSEVFLLHKSKMLELSGSKLNVS